MRTDTRRRRGRHLGDFSGVPSPAARPPHIPLLLSLVSYSFILAHLRKISIMKLFLSLALVSGVAAFSPSAVVSR
jgi:hypothetical protein